MKFIKLESRGGNYLVVASNVAWLRVAEKGQTNVGIIGGQPLLVVGSIEEVAEKILNGVKGADAEEPPAPAAVPAPAPAPQEVAAPVVAVEVPVAEPAPVAASVPEFVADPPAPAQPEPVAEPVPIAPEPAHEPVAPVAPATPESASGPQSEPAFEPVRLQLRQAPLARSRSVVSGNAALWERPVAPPPKGLKIKAGSQRMMGMLE